MTRPLRVACALPSVSHFEVPLLRLCAEQEDLRFRVFHLAPIPLEPRFAEEYDEWIDWGEDMASGYDAVHCETPAVLRRKVVAWKPDVILIYGYSWPGSLALILSCRVRRIPLTHRGPVTFLKDPRSGLATHLRRPLRPMILRMFQSHHYSGGHSETVLREAGVGEDQLFLVPYGVDSSHFSAERKSKAAEARRLRASLGFEDDAHVVLFLCQHNWFKGPDIALEIFAAAQKIDPKIRALIVGKGRETQAMIRTAEKCLEPDTYHFSGFVPSKQTVPYYLASDLVIFPSRYETWARGVNEAMLCGRVPIVSRRIPASDGLVSDGSSGIVVEEPKAAAFASAVQQFFVLPRAQRQAMEASARSDAMALSYERHLTDLKSSFYSAAGLPLPSTEGVGR